MACTSTEAERKSVLTRTARFRIRELLTTTHHRGSLCAMDQPLSTPKSRHMYVVVRHNNSQHEGRYLLVGAELQFGRRSYNQLDSSWLDSFGTWIEGVVDGMVWYGKAVAGSVDPRMLLRTGVPDIEQVFWMLSIRGRLSLEYT